MSNHPRALRGRRSSIASIGHVKDHGGLYGDHPLHDPGSALDDLTLAASDISEAEASSASGGGSGSRPSTASAGARRTPDISGARHEGYIFPKASSWSPSRTWL